jgi:hypothetical protein
MVNVRTLQVAVEACIEDPDSYEIDTLRMVLADALGKVAPMYVDLLAQKIAERPCNHPGLFATYDAPNDHTSVAYKLWLDKTQLCGACLQRVPNREL